MGTFVRVCMYSCVHVSMRKRERLYVCLNGFLCRCNSETQTARESVHKAPGGFSNVSVGVLIPSNTV